MGGAGEVLRALLMLQLGAEPEGLTEALRAGAGGLPGAARAGRRAPDAAAARRERDRASAGAPIPRLVVETLLLRWAMLDRIVDLEQVLAGAGQRRAAAGSRADAPRPRHRRADAASAIAARAQPSASPAPQPGPPAAASAPPSLAAAATAPSLDAARRRPGPTSWREVRSRSRFLGEALAATVPGRRWTLPWLTVGARRAQPALRRAAAGAGPGGGGGPAPEPSGSRSGSGSPSAASGRARRPSRRAELTEASLKADRLRAFRAKDPALDTAADALDLEIVD